MVKDQSLEDCRISLVNFTGYILASLDLAHEYVTLGKLRRAVSIFSPAHDIVRSRQASREVSVRFLLRFGESLAIFEDIPKRWRISTSSEVNVCG